jgi:Cytochrome P460
MRFSFTAAAALSLPALVAATMPGAAPAKPAAQFEGKDTLLRPEGYREWVFVGSSLGLRYEGGKKQPERLEFKNVYIDPAAYRAYKETGAFPRGTVLVLETAAGEEKKEPGLRGSFQKELNGLSAAVKDKGRFPDGWAYFSFSDGPGKTKARPAKKSACYDCHREKGAEDNVFTQFYPVLKAARARAAGPSWEGKSALLSRAGVPPQLSSARSPRTNPISSRAIMPLLPPLTPVGGTLSPGTIPAIQKR